MALYRITSRTTGEAFVRSTGGMDSATEALTMIGWHAGYDVERIDQ